MATLTFGLIIIVYLGYKVLSLAKKYNVGKTILDIKNGLKYAK